jgi:hypothetical protein
VSRLRSSKSGPVSYAGHTEVSDRTEVEEVYGPLEWDGCWLINRPPFGIGFDFGGPPVGRQRVKGIYVFQE